MLLDLLERPRRSSRCTRARTAGRRRRRRAGRPSGRCWTAGRCRESHRLVAEVDRRARRLRHRTRAGQALAGVHRRPVQLVRPAFAPPVLGRRPRGARHPARVPRGADPAARAVHAVRHRAGLAAPGSPSTRTGARLGAPGRVAGGRRRRWSTTELGEQMALVRRLVELGRAARAESGVKTRQPLARALVAAPGWAALPAELRREVADELNVGRAGRARPDAGDLVDVTVKPNFRALGKRFGPKHPGRAPRRSRPPTPRRWSAARSRPGGRVGRPSTASRSSWAPTTWSSPRRRGRAGRSAQRGARRRARPGADPGAARGRAGAGRGPARAGGAQGAGPRRHRPDRAVVAGRWLAGAGGGHP